MTTVIAIGDYLKYDKETGFITWIKKPNKSIVLNSIAGNKNLLLQRSI